MNRKYLVYSLPILLILILIFVFIPRQKSISIIIDGKEQIIETTKSKVEDILVEAGLFLYPEDQINPDLEKRMKDGESIEIFSAITYLIIADGETERITLTANSPKEILKIMGIEYDSEDLILVDGIAHSDDEIIDGLLFATIELRRSVELNVQIGNETQKIQTTAATVGEALWKANIPLYQNEQLSIPIHSPLSQATTITISPAKEIEIIIGEKSIHLHATAETVGEALALAGISLQNLDYSLPAEDKTIPENGIIEVFRVEEAILGEQELIPFYSLLQPMPDVEIDNQTILQVGEYGLKAQRIRVRYENGEEVLRNIEDEWVVREPVPRIEGYGTYIDLKLMDTPHGQINYYRTIEFYVTSYKAGDNTTPPWFGRVKCWNREFEPGFVAVDLDYFPCGTRLYIPGFGHAVAMDTGLITGAWLDIGYYDDEYVAWHQYITVYVLSPPPPDDQIPYIIPPGDHYTP